MKWFCACEKRTGAALDNATRNVTSGMALLVVSSDLPEVLALAHRIVVMSEGRVAGELDAANATEVGILELAAPKSEVTEEAA